MMIPKEVYALYLFAEDQSGGGRRGLDFICIERQDDTNAIAVATNGHHMATFVFPCDTATQLTSPIYIHKEHAAALLKVAKVGEGVGGYAELVPSAFHAHQFDSTYMQYPAWEAAVKDSLSTSDAVKGPLGFDIQYLAVLAKYCKAVGSTKDHKAQQHHVVLISGDADVALTFKTLISGFTYYLMPRRA